MSRRNGSRSLWRSHPDRGPPFGSPEEPERPGRRFGKDSLHQRDDGASEFDDRRGANLGRTPEEDRLVLQDPPRCDFLRMDPRETPRNSSRVRRTGTERRRAAAARPCRSSQPTGIRPPSGSAAPRRPQAGQRGASTGSVSEALTRATRRAAAARPLSRVAEGQGFEPWVTLRPRRFSKPTPARLTPPDLQADFQELLRRTTARSSPSSRPRGRRSTPRRARRSCVSRSVSPARGSARSARNEPAPRFSAA